MKNLKRVLSAALSAATTARSARRPRSSLPWRRPPSAISAPSRLSRSSSRAKASKHTFTLISREAAPTRLPLFCRWKPGGGSCGNYRKNGMNESGGNPIGPIGLIGPITLAVGPYGCFEAMHTYGKQPPAS